MSSPFEVVEAVARIPKSDLRELRLEINKHASGRVFLNLREWYRERPATDEWKPGRGVTVPLRLVRELAEALAKVCGSEHVRIAAEK